MTKCFGYLEKFLNFDVCFNNWDNCASSLVVIVNKNIVFLVAQKP